LDQLKDGVTYTITYIARNESGESSAKCDIVVGIKSIPKVEGDLAGAVEGDVWYDYNAEA
jgi:hypothetical protein